MKNKIVTKLMKSGLKFKSEQIYLKSVKTLQKKVQKSHYEIIKLAIVNSSPFANVRKKFNKRKRRVIKEVPYVLTESNRINFAITNILLLVKKRSVKNCISNFVEELIQSAKNNSESVLKKNELHKEAFLKKKYAAFRWF